MSLPNLESKKVMMDFKHAREELLLKKEMVSEIDPLFNKAINDFLKTNKPLKDRWDNMFDATNGEDEEENTNTGVDKFNTERLSDSDDSVKEAEAEAESLKEDDTEEIDDPFASVYKMVYREIVKKTHPDKITHLSEEEREHRNIIYLDATKAQEKKNIGELLYCAYQLKISFGIGKEEILMLNESVEKYKKEASFLEQTYSWKWFYSDDVTKRMLVERFITQIIEEQ
jgi:hypothetical protein